MANMRDFPQYTAGGTLTKNSEYAECHEINFWREFGAKIANMRKVTKKLSAGIWRENIEYAKGHEIHFRRESGRK